MYHWQSFSYKKDVGNFYLSDVREDIDGIFVWSVICFKTTACTKRNEAVIIN